MPTILAIKANEKEKNGWQPRGEKERRKIFFGFWIKGGHGFKKRGGKAFLGYGVNCREGKKEESVLCLLELEL